MTIALKSNDFKKWYNYVYVVDPFLLDIDHFILFVLRTKIIKKFNTEELLILLFYFLVDFFDYVVNAYNEEC